VTPERTSESSLVLRAVSGDGSRRVVGDEPLVISVRDVHDQRLLIADVNALLGAPAVLLGTVGDELEVEVLGDQLGHGLRWADEPLPTAERPVWGCPGWYASTTDWIDETLGRAGLDRTGPPEQIKHWSISALLRIPAGGGDVWFKQVPDVFAHEGRLTAWIGEVAPGLVPTVLAHEPGRWLADALAAPVEASDDMGDYDALTRLQQQIAGRAAELVDLGCPDRRPQTLPAALEQLAARIEVLGEERAERLRAVVPLLSAPVDLLHQSGLTESLVHGDFHPGNTRCTADGWRIYDWTDGCLSHPLLDLATVLRPGDMDNPRIDRALRLWPDATRDVVQAALTAGAAFQALTYERIADAVTPSAGPMWLADGHRWVDRLLIALSDGQRG